MGTGEDQGGHHHRGISLLQDTPTYTSRSKSAAVSRARLRQDSDFLTPSTRPHKGDTNLLVALHRSISVCKRLQGRAAFASLTGARLQTHRCSRVPAVDLWALCLASPSRRILDSCRLFGVAEMGVWVRGTNRQLGRGSLSERLLVSATTLDLAASPPPPPSRGTISH